MKRKLDYFQWETRNERKKVHGKDTSEDQLDTTFVDFNLETRNYSA